jgi:hypothetical protein
VDSLATPGQSGDRPVPSWVLLIYMVPASPTSKRAAVWREVKRLGALYLRDGVCALPETAAARSDLEALAGRVQELGGQSTVVWKAEISPATAEALQAELIHARLAEYAEVADTAADLLRHIRREAAHHAFDRAARANIAGDLGRLQRWVEQIVARDYLQVGDALPARALLADCRAELENHTALAAGQGK